MAEDNKQGYYGEDEKEDKRKGKSGFRVLMKKNVKKKQGKEE